MYIFFALKNTSLRNTVYQRFTRVTDSKMALILLHTNGETKCMTLNI